MPKNCIEYHTHNAYPTWNLFKINLLFKVLFLDMNFKIQAFVLTIWDIFCQSFIIRYNRINVKETYVLNNKQSWNFKYILSILRLYTHSKPAASCHFKGDPGFVGNSCIIDMVALGIIDIICIFPVLINYSFILFPFVQK